MDAVVGRKMLLPPPVNVVEPPSGALCTTCGGGANASGTENSDNAEPISPSFLYATGRIHARLPTRGVAKELAQTIPLGATNPLEDPEVLRQLLAENRYLVRHLCWVLTIEGDDAYILLPRNPRGFEMLIDAISESQKPGDFDYVRNVVVGLVGPLASPEMCNGLQVPMVVFDQVYSVTEPELIEGGSQVSQDPEFWRRLRLAPPEGGRDTAEVTAILLQAAENLGRTNEDRAVNFALMRDPEIHALTANIDGKFDLGSVRTQESNLSGIAEDRVIYDVIFKFISPDRTLEYFVRVDVTREFPFIHTPLQRFLERRS